MNDIPRVPVTTITICESCGHKTLDNDVDMNAHGVMSDICPRCGRNPDVVIEDKIFKYLLNRYFAFTNKIGIEPNVVVMSKDDWYELRKCILGDPTVVSISCSSNVDKVLGCRIIAVHENCETMFLLSAED